MNLKPILASVTLVLLMLASCTVKRSADIAIKSPLEGTWKLISGTLIEKGNTTVTDYTKNQSFIKVINQTHFAFLLHDLNGGKDSTAVYSSGGGRYTLSDSTYTERLEYCTAREWEGHDFTFTVTFKGDTLIQQGREVIETSGIDRLNIEKYIRVR